jgi:cytochrome b561
MSGIEIAPQPASPPRYGAVAQALHWLTAVLVLIAFILGPGGNEQRVYSAAHAVDRPIHETIGLCVFALVLARLAWRRIARPPQLPPMHAALRLLARTFHAALYVLLLGVPLTAIFGAWLEGHPLTLVGGLEIAPWIAESHAVGTKVASIHQLLGDVLIWLAGFHAAAAMIHHFVLRDGVLRAMLPSRAGRAR